MLVDDGGPPRVSPETVYLCFNVAWSHERFLSFKSGLCAMFDYAARPAKLL